MVTVLMPVYNGEKYLREAIDSVLCQTYKEFEFLIINDGSSDGSLDIINSYNDPRIRLISNEKNIQLIATLNLGLKLAKGKYIARMDCDDVSYPERLQEQVNFMDTNPEIGISGTWYIRSDNNQLNQRPVSHEEIKVFLIKGAAILHPTAIFRKELFDKHQLRFKSEYIHAEDYELWVRASALFKLANIPKPLLQYRKHPKQVSQSYSKEQKETTRKIMTYHLKSLGLEPSMHFARLNLQLFAKSKLRNKQVKALSSYIDLILAANKKVRYYDQKILKLFMDQQRELLWDRCQLYSFKTLKTYHQSLGFTSQGFSLKLYLKILKRVIVNSLQFTKKDLSVSI
ncbi:MAG: glycosyltransferase [Bacteroidota bacterium]|nr:glycosyltransferase [Bacteroidota bacterium]